MINIVISADNKSKLQTDTDYILIGGNSYLCFLDAPDSDAYTTVDELIDSNNIINATNLSINQKLNESTTFSFNILGTDMMSIFRPENKTIIAIYRTDNDNTNIRELFRGIVISSTVSQAKTLQIIAKDFLWSLFNDEADLDKLNYGIETYRMTKVIKQTGAFFYKRYNVNTEAPPSFFGDATNKFAEVINLYDMKIYPYASGIIKVAFEKRDQSLAFLNSYELYFKDFAIESYNAVGKLPGQIISEICSMAGAYMKVVGNKLIIIEKNYNINAPKIVYNDDNLLTLDKSNTINTNYNAVVIRGKSTPFVSINYFKENKPFDAYPDFMDFNGYALLAQEEGTYNPQSGFSQSTPEPLKYYVEYDSDVYDGSTLEIVGNAIVIQDFEAYNENTSVGQVVLGIPINYYDLRLSPPFVVDPITKRKIYNMHGIVIDASTGSGMPGVPVRAIRFKNASATLMTSPDIYETVTSKTGAYMFSNIPLGEYRIESNYLDNSTNNYNSSIESSDYLSDSYRNLIHESEYWDGIMANNFNSGYQLLPTRYSFEVYIKAKNYADARENPAGSYRTNVNNALGSVFVEIRLNGTDDDDLRYAPILESVNITNEEMAVHIGELVLKGSNYKKDITNINALGSEAIHPGDCAILNSGQMNSNYDFLIDEISKTLHGAVHKDIIRGGYGSLQDTVSRINGLVARDDIIIGVIQEVHEFSPNVPAPTHDDIYYDVVIYQSGNNKILTNVSATGDRRYILNSRAIFEMPQYKAGDVVLVTNAISSSDRVIIGKINNAYQKRKVIYV